MPYLKPNWACKLIWGVALAGGLVYPCANSHAMPAEDQPKVMSIPPSRQRAMRELGIDPEEFLRSTIRPLSTTESVSLEARRHFFMATYLGQTGRIPAALERLAKADQLQPGNYYILLLRAEYLLETGSIQEGLAALNRILNSLAEDVPALLLKAQALLVQSDGGSSARRSEMTKGALAVLQSARKSQPRNESVLRNLGRLYARLNDLKGLESAYRDLVDAAPRDPGTKLFLARLLSETNRPDESLEYYDKVINQRRSFIPARLEKARLQEMLGRLPAAAETYRDALLVEPRNRQVRDAFDRVLRLTHIGDDAKGKILEEYSRFSAQYPYSSEIRRIYAEQLLSAGDKDGAIREFRRIVSADNDNPDAHLNLAKLLISLNRTDEALTELKQAHELKPDASDVLSLLGSTLLSVGRAPEASELFRKALRDLPDDPDLQLGLAAVLVESNDPDTAQELIHKILPKIEKDSGKLAQAGQLLLRTRNFPRAAEVLGKATASAPADPRILSLAIRAFIRTNKPEDAVSLVDRARAAKISVATEDLYVLLAEEFQAAGQVEQAAQWYRRAYDSAPDRLGILARLVTHYSASKQSTKALDVIAEIRRTSEDSDDLLRLEASVHLEQNDFDKAIAAYSSLKAKRPGSIEVALLLAEAYAVAKRPDAALAEIEQAEKKFGKVDDIEFSRGIVFLRLKRYDQAVRVFRKLAEAGGKRSLDSYFFLATTLVDLKKPDDAEKAYQAGLKKQEDDPRLLNGLGYLYADRNTNIREARSLVERALEMQPRAGHIIDTMAWVLYREGRFEEAYEWIKEALAFSGQEAEILEHKGLILEALQRPVEAAEAYNSALAIEPNRTQVKERLKSLPQSSDKNRSPGKR